MKNNNSRVTQARVKIISKWLSDKGYRNPNISKQERSRKVRAFSTHCEYILNLLHKEDLGREIIEMILEERNEKQ